MRESSALRFWGGGGRSEAKVERERAPERNEGGGMNSAADVFEGSEE